MTFCCETWNLRWTSEGPVWSDSTHRACTPSWTMMLFIFMNIKINFTFQQNIVPNYHSMALYYLRFHLLHYASCHWLISNHHFVLIINAYPLWAYINTHIPTHTQIYTYTFILIHPSQFLKFLYKKKILQMLHTHTFILIHPCFF